MTTQTPDQLGICSWSTHPSTPQELAIRTRELGLTKVQLALMSLLDEPEVWGDVQSILAAEGVTIVSGMCGTTGEDYSTLESIHRTGGFVPDATWDQSWARMQQFAKIAQGLGLSEVSTHSGFLPADPSSPDFAKLVGRVAEVANCFSDHGLNLIFETGQETAATLANFLAALDEKGATNTGVNFDPANMILYDMGDPVESFKTIASRVWQVHIKDATRSPVKGEWGLEVPIGDGEVDWPAFVQALNEADFTGNLVIEREAGDNRIADVRTAIERLSEVMAQVAVAS